MNDELKPRPKKTYKYKPTPPPPKPKPVLGISKGEYDKVVGERNALKAALVGMLDVLLSQKALSRSDIREKLLVIAKEAVGG